MLKSEHYRRQIPHFSLDKVLVGRKYDEDMRRKIHRFKFVHNYVDRVYFQEIFWQLEAEFQYIPDVIVFPPVSIFDRIFRGKNHAQILASFVSTKVPILCPFGKKCSTRHQSQLMRKDRKHVELLYHFREKFQQEIQQKKILLVDDLITT